MDLDQVDTDAFFGEFRLSVYRGVELFNFDNKLSENLLEDSLYVALLQIVFDYSVQPQHASLDFQNESVWFYNTAFFNLAIEVLLGRFLFAKSLVPLVD